MARVLIIEDNAINLELMSYLLTQFGHEVTAATSGDAGLERAAEVEPDLIACDLHMPKMDGFEVLRALKSRPKLSSVPVVAVTASAMVGNRQQVLAAGFDGYISKPIDPETFVAQLEAFLRAQPPSD